MKVQNILTPLWFALKIKFVLKIRKQCVGNVTDFFIAKQIKKPYDCALFCCKALMQRSRALKKKGETLDYVSCFPQPTLLSCSSRFLRALKLHEQSTVKASLVVNYNYNFSSFQSKTDSNTTIAPKTASCPVIRFFGFCWTQLAFFQLFITFMTQTAHSCPS